MKTQLWRGIVAAVFLVVGIFSCSTLSATPYRNRFSPNVEDLGAKTRKLERELKQLKYQVRMLQKRHGSLGDYRSGRSRSRARSHSHSHSSPRNLARPVNTSTFSATQMHSHPGLGVAGKPGTPTVVVNARGATGEVAPSAIAPLLAREAPSRHDHGPKKMSARQHAILHGYTLEIYQAAQRYIAGDTVTTSPLLGLKTAFAPTDLLYQMPSMNEDLILLRARQHFEGVLNTFGSSLNDHPVVVLSGGIEGQIIRTNPYVGNPTTDVNLSTAELDIWPIMSKWASGFASFVFDSAPPQTGTRVTNSRLFLQRGFLTIGNLEVFPLYFTIGQMFVPFGKYASIMLTNPLTKSLARIQVRAAQLGFYKNGIYLAAYGFPGNKRPLAKDVIQQGGVNAGYELHPTEDSSFDIGAGYVSNIADSQGMQGNGLPFVLPPFTSTQFAGFGNTVGGNQLRHSVGAVDVHMEATYKHFTLITEYVSSVRRFAPTDLLFNGMGAKPAAVHNELDINLHAGRRPITIGLVFDKSWQCLPLNLPQDSYVLVISSSIWKDTVTGIEYRHDVNYAREPATSVGGGGGAPPGTALPVPLANVGSSRDLITVMFGVYF